MASPVEADAPIPAQREADSGWGMKIAAGVAGFILVVEFVLPGFLAAGFSHAREAAITYAPGHGYEKLASFRLEGIILAPAFWLGDRSEAIGDFYEWEYHAAGGKPLYRGN